jgi:hypothetical protein
MLEKHSNLINLADLLNSGSENPGIGEAAVLDPGIGKAAVLEFHDGTVTEDRFDHADKLLKYWDRLGKESPPKCNRRLYLLEGLPPKYIEILGSRFRIDPNVFARQVRSDILKLLDDMRDVPLLSSHPTSKESFLIRYHELRDFDDRIHDYELRSVNQLRRISVSKFDGKFDCVGMVRKNASFWFKKDEDGGWNGMSRPVTTRSILS